jgi:hypothetical protein
MKKNLILVMLIFAISVLAGCQTTTETTARPTSWPVGVWIVPLGEDVPAYFQDFDDERAIKFYRERNAATHATNLIVSEYIGDVMSGTPTCLPDSIGPAGTCLLMLSGALFLDSSIVGTIQVSLIYANAEGVYTPENAIGLQMTAGSTTFYDWTTTVSTQPGQYTFDIHVAFVDTPQLIDARVNYYDADGQLIGGQVLVLSGGGGPWTASLFNEIAYVVVEETFAGDDVQRTLYSRVPGGSLDHNIKVQNDFGIFEHDILTIDWGD